MRPTADCLLVPAMLEALMGVSCKLTMHTLQPSAPSADSNLAQPQMSTVALLAAFERILQRPSVS